MPTGEGALLADGHRRDGRPAGVEAAQGTRVDGDEGLAAQLAEGHEGLRGRGAPGDARDHRREIGRASCRERV